MKINRIISCVLLQFLILTIGCSNDDNHEVIYEKISQEDKEFLLGNWKVMSLSSSVENKYSFERGEEVFYQFMADGKLIVKNTLAVQAESGGSYSFFVHSDTLNYTFEYSEQKDSEVSRKEKLKIFNEEIEEYFSFHIRSDKEIDFSQRDGFRLKLINANDYRKISDETKEKLIGNWRLLKIADFSGRTREFGEDEEVYYEFTMDGKVIVQNISALSDEIFDTFLISRTFKYYYEYDPYWVEGEVMIMEHGGSFSIGVSEERLVLAQYDGPGIWFERVE